MARYPSYRQPVLWALMRFLNRLLLNRGMDSFPTQLRNDSDNLEKIKFRIITIFASAVDIKMCSPAKEQWIIFFLQLTYHYTCKCGLWQCVPFSSTIYTVISSEHNNTLTIDYKFVTPYLVTIATTIWSQWLVLRRYCACDLCQWCFVVGKVTLSSIASSRFLSVNHRIEESTLSVSCTYCVEWYRVNTTKLLTECINAVSVCSDVKRFTGHGTILY